MAVEGSDWRAKRARERRRVAAVNRSSDRDRVNALLAGGNRCTNCGAYGVRYSVRSGERRCGECGFTYQPPAA